MKKLNSFWAILVLFMCVTASSVAQTKAPTAVGDILWQTDFLTLPAGTTFTSGDLYTASTSNENLTTTEGGIVFGAGPNGERINFNNSQAANQFGSTATTYVSATAADDGATPGAFSFIKNGNTANGGGGYIITPQVQGPCNAALWTCTGSTVAQMYDVYTIENGGAPAFLVTTTINPTKLIRKNVYNYSGSGLIQFEFVMSNKVSSTNSNLYFYNIVFTQAAPPTIPTIAYSSGNTAQTVYQRQTITPIVYQFGGSANATTVAWTGTANSSTAPDGVTVSTVGTNVTIAVALSTLGSYGYSITATDGTNTTAALVGTLNTKTTTKYKMAYVTTVMAGAPAVGDFYFINGFTNNPGNDGFSKDFDLTYINATDTGIDYSIYDVIVESSIPSSASAGLAELKTKCLSKPFVNMKEFQLQVSAWNWAVPSNTTATTMIVADAAKTHPLFSGITFSGAASNEIILTTATTGNLAVNISSWVGTPTPAVPTTLSTTKDPSSGVSTGLACYFEIPVGTTMNGMSTATSAKQVVFGLSEATYNTGLTADAITIAVNAAKYVMTPNVTTAVQPTLNNSKTVVSKEFYDITGKKLNQYAKGILIEKSIYTDGSNSYKKIFRADL